MTPASIILPRPLQRFLDGLRAGRGISSQPSPLTTDGARPDLTPIVCSLSRAGGLTHFLTTLATISAWNEEGTGEPILMLSWGLEPEALKSLLETSGERGGAGEIAFSVTMSAGEPAGTSPSTSPKHRIIGTLGAPCERCRLPFRPGEAYIEIVIPPDRLMVYHGSCGVKQIRELDSGIVLRAQFPD